MFVSYFFLSCLVKAIRNAKFDLIPYIFRVSIPGIPDASAEDRVDEDVDDDEQEIPAPAASEDVPKLNVSEKDSPYALISKFFPDRERNHRRMQNNFEKSFVNGQLSREQVDSIGELGPEEIWLSEGNLLVLKGGGSSNDRSSFVNPWEPLDDFQAPYREPKLPPPDFIPTENGVGVPLPPEDEQEDNPRTGINFFLSEEKKKEEKEKEKVKEELKFKQNFIPDDDDDSEETVGGSLPPETLRNFVFPEFFNEEQYINEMENFHSIRHAQYLAAKLQEANGAVLKKPSKMIVPPPTAKPSYFVSSTTPESFSYAYVSTTSAPPIHIQSPRPHLKPRPLTTPRPSFNIATPSPRPKKFKHYPVVQSSPKTVPIPASYKQRRLPTPRPRLTFLSEQQKQKKKKQKKKKKVQQHLPPPSPTTALPISTTAYNHNTEINPSYLRQLTTPKSFYSSPILSNNNIQDSAAADNNHSNQKQLFYPAVTAVKSSKYLIKSLAKEYAGRAVKSSVPNNRNIFSALSNEIDGSGGISEQLFHAIKNPHKQRQIPPPPPPPPHRAPKKISHFSPPPQQQQHHHHHSKPAALHIQPRSRAFKPSPRRRISYTGGPPKPSEVRSLPTGGHHRGSYLPQQQYQSPSETYANFVAPQTSHPLLPPPQTSHGVSPSLALAPSGVRRTDSERYVSFYRGSVGGRSWGYSYRL